MRGDKCYTYQAVRVESFSTIPGQREFSKFELQLVQVDCPDFNQPPPPTGGGRGSIGIPYFDTPGSNSQEVPVYTQDLMPGNSYANPSPNPVVTGPVSLKEVYIDNNCLI